MRDALREMKAREELQAREKAENAAALERVKATGRPTTFIAADGCEVTVTVTGHVFHNMADWY